MPAISLPCPFERDVLLANRAYYGIGGRAMVMAFPGSLSEIADLLLWNREKRYPFALMGSGSNILFSDEPFPGVVISFVKMRKMFWTSETELFCEAGVENTRIAEELLRAGKSGGEWLFRLPGQIGSTVRMNARCFGGEISSVTAGIAVLHADGRILWHGPEEVFQGYKQTSLMESPEIVAGVLLRFSQSGSYVAIEEQMRQYERERDEKHHFDFPSCGSTFKNNYDAGRSSGKIFDELGFRGAQEGGAEVSGHHANFIFNRGGATAADVLRLAGRMRGAALANAGVRLDLEVQCIGLFERQLLDACGVAYNVDPLDEAMGWTGLWLMPEPDASPRLTCYPRTLVEGPLFGYFGKDREYPTGVFVTVEQLVSLDNARREPDSPLLRWTTMPGDGSAFTITPPESPAGSSFIDGLWQFSVSELFLGRGDRQGGYLEFEMTPDAHWVALRFSAPREREEGFSALSAEPWENHAIRFSADGTFGMELTFSLLEPFITETVIRLQCCASSGRNEYGLFPWWPVSTDPTDFHQPEKYFSVRLA
jgi:UDP-N-acetylmuramate dehydrogenase